MSDTHIGYNMYRSEVRKQDFADAFQDSINVAINQNVSAVIHTGDLFDSSDPTSSDISSVISGLNRLKTNDINFYGISGDHEKTGGCEWVDTLQRAGLIRRLSNEPIVEENVAIYGIDALEKGEWCEDTFNFVQSGKADHNVLCMHELVSPPISEDSVYSSVKDAEDIIKWSNIELDLIALGDRHKRGGEELKGVTIHYAGSTERTSRNNDPPFSVEIYNFEFNGISMEYSGVNYRDFEHKELNISQGDTTDDIEDRVHNWGVDDSCLKVDVVGSNKKVAVREIRNIILSTKDLVHLDIKDNRDENQIDVELEKTDGSSIEDEIDEVLDDLEVSDVDMEIDQTIRNLNNSKSKIRNTIRDKIREKVINYED